MTPDEIRASNERALRTMREIIDTHRASLEMAERNFPGSTLAEQAKAQLDAAQSEYVELEARVARVVSLLERKGFD